MSLCWGGILSADWKDDQVKTESSISINRASFERIGRFTKNIYPKINLKRETIADLLPPLENVEIRGSGTVRGKIYNWKADINSKAKSISIIPDRFWDITGRYYPINQSRKMVIEKLPTYTNLKNAVIYEINTNMIGNDAAENSSFKVVSSINELIEQRAVTEDYPRDRFGFLKTSETLDICAANYLAVFVNNNNDYWCLVGTKEGEKTFWAKPSKPIIVSQFKGISMWRKFQDLNTLIYYLLTVHQDNIVKIPTNHLWCYIDPSKMEPYSDIYWFDQGDIYYTQDLTLAPKDKELKGGRIMVRGNVWPGMYMMLGETFIRRRGTDEDEHMQIKIPFCKVKSDHSITLEAGGEPVVMNIDLEVAQPRNNIMMELNTYETAPRLIEDNKRFYAVDGSTEVLSE